MAAMGQSSSERAWATRARRRRGHLTAEERERLDRYTRSCSGSQSGRPRSSTRAASREASAPAAADQTPLQEPPAPESQGAGGQGGGGPPIDLGAPPGAANDEAPSAAPDGAEDAAAKAAAERTGFIKMGAAYIVAVLRKCEPIIRAAELPLPPLPEFALVVVEQCWELTLDKYLPAELGDPREYAELVACSTTGYQLCLTWWAGKRLKAREDEKPAAAAAAPASSASAPPPPPVAPPPAPTNGESKDGPSRKGFFFTAPAVPAVGEPH